MTSGHVPGRRSPGPPSARPAIRSPRPAGIAGRAPTLFCNDDGLAEDLLAAAGAAEDPVRRLPLWRPHPRLLDSKVADIGNVPEGPFACAIAAALHLQEFVDANTPWAHPGIMAWNLADRPGRPAGGEAQGLRAVFELVERRFR